LLPGMAFDGQAKSSKLSQYQGLFCTVYRRIRHHRIRIIVDVQYIAYTHKIATTGTAYDAGGIILAGAFGNFLRFELPPGLIERHPHHDTGEVVEGIHNGFPFLAVDSFGFCCTVLVVLVSADLARMHVPTIAAQITARHILPDDHANT